MTDFDTNRFKKVTLKIIRTNYLDNVVSRNNYSNQSIKLNNLSKNNHKTKVTKSTLKKPNYKIRFIYIIKKFINHSKLINYLKKNKHTNKISLIYKSALKNLSKKLNNVYIPISNVVKPFYIKISDPIIEKIGRKRFKLLSYGFIGLLGLVFIITGSFAYYHSLVNSSYNLPVNEQAIIGQPDSNLMSKFSYDSKTHAYYLSKSSISTTSSESPSSLSDAISIGGSSKNKAKYSLKLPTNASEGITTYDNTSNISFTMIPLFSTYSGKQVSGHTIYPISINGPKAVYTVKANGVQEDVVYAKAPKGTIKLQYKLKLPSTLQARMMPGNNIGIYSASPYLFGNITYGSSGDQKKVQLARDNSAKNNLVFVLLAPKIFKASGLLTTTDKQHVSLALTGNIVSVTASGLGNIKGPISIDPSVIVASASNFMNGGNNEGDITYDSTNNQITEAGLTGGTIGPWSSTTSFTATSMPARAGLGVVAYKGNIYVIGGNASAPTGDCTAANDNCNGVFYASISNGTIGAWTQDTTATFPSGMPARGWLSTIAYNGYIYAMGGLAGASSGDCTATSHYCNGVFYAPISSSGIVGAWTQDTTATFPSGMPARIYFGAIAYNGYMYIMGGRASASTGDCTASGNFCNGVFYSAINADGTIGAWATTTTFSSSNPTMPAREGMGVVAYNGYIYVIGGGAGASSGDCTATSNYCNGVFYASINGNGTIGSWASTTSFTATIMPARSSLVSISYDGYIYAMGGFTGSSSTGDCTASGYCNGVFYAPINSNGTIGSWAATTTFPSSSPTMPARYALGGLVYNGYLFALGGLAGASSGDCTAGYNYCNGVFSAPINGAGVIGTNWTSTTAFTTTSMPAREGFGVVVNNGYLYVMGGVTDASNGDCTANSSTAYACNGVFYASINSNGTIGSWTQDTTATFPSGMPARYGLGAVTYNGYMYITGGIAVASSGDCTAAADFCNGVWYASINSSGVVSAWTQDTTATFPSGMPARADFGLGPGNQDSLATIAYNGYMYILGGVAGASSGDCTAAADFCNGVWYASINSSGVVSAWTQDTTATFPSGMPARDGFGAITYNGYLYVVGGKASTSSGDCTAAVDFCNGVWYASINSSGVVSAWTQDTTATFPSGMPARGYFSIVAYNGYMYILGGVAGASSGDCTATVDFCNGVWYASINSSGVVSAWTATTAFPSTMPARSGYGSVTYNGFLYVLGGTAGVSGGDCTTTYYMCNGVYYIPINNGGPGTISTWTSSTSFTTTAMPARYGLSSVAYNGYIYVMGGIASASTGDCTAASDYCNGVFYDSITNAGSLGVSWTATTSFTATSMPARYDFGAVAYNGYIYVMGGRASASTGDCTAASNICNGVFYDSIGSNGALGGSWTATTTFTTTSMPARYQMGSVAYNGYIYVLGGDSSLHSGDCTATNDACNGVFYDSIGSNGALGGSWTATTTFTTTSMPARSGFSAIVYDGYIYVIGGVSFASSGDCTYHGGVAYGCNGVFYDSIGSNGALGGSWTATSSFALYREFLGAVAYNGNLYIMGGTTQSSAGDCSNGGSYCNGAFYAPINNNGSIGSWQPTTNFTATTMPARYSFGITAYEGNIYVLGGFGSASTGDCTATSNYCNGVFISGIQSIPRVGLYSRLIDFTGLSSDDPNPAGILTDGGDCSTGVCSTNLSNPGLGGISGPGGIIINYKFASNACTTFNSPTTLPTGLNLIGNYFPLTFTTDGCSNTTNVGRYMWVSYQLDDSQTATFPDSSGNHSSIADFTVYYHPATNYRMRGGATFSNGSLQSLDAIP